MDSVIISVLQKVNKQVEGKLKNFRDKRTKKRVKSYETRDVPMPADTLMDI